MSRNNLKHGLAVTREGKVIRMILSVKPLNMDELIGARKILQEQVGVHCFRPATPEEVRQYRDMAWELK